MSPSAGFVTVTPVRVALPLAPVIARMTTPVMPRDDGSRVIAPNSCPSAQNFPPARYRPLLGDQRGPAERLRVVVGRQTVRVVSPRSAE
jgi:hypothetical protein